MAKENAFYFTHDFNTRNDAKIKNLLSVHGFLGYGLFWAIIEDLYNNANALPLNCKVIAYDLRTKEKIIHSIIHDFDLFVIEKNIFGSRSVQRRLEDRDAKSIKARESAFKRWENDANAKQSQSKPSAIKESKVKESKKKENKGNKTKDIIFTEMVKIWFDWYEFNFHVKPKFNDTDGAKIKSIRTYLESLISAKQPLTDELLYDGFKIVLEYSLKHEFVSKNVSLQIIEMKLNEIIALTTKRPSNKSSKQDDAMLEAKRISELKYNKDNGIRNLE